MMMISRAGLLGLTLSGMLLLGADARAVEIRYTTVGIFTDGDEAGSSVYLDSANGIRIEFENALNELVNVPIGATSQVSFGTFNTSGTTRPPGAGGGNFGTVSSGFILNIFQSVPYDGDLQFVGALTGRLHSTASQAWIQFDGPLQQTITGPGIPIIYGIASADRPFDNGPPVPGRVNLSPPTANNGRTTIVGSVTPIPEPSAMILVGMGAAAPLALTIRHRRGARASA